MERMEPELPRGLWHLTLVQKARAVELGEKMRKMEVALCGRVVLTNEGAGWILTGAPQPKPLFDLA